MAITLSLLGTLSPAGPQDGQISSGVGSISQTGTTTTITQSSAQLSLGWKSFDIGTHETVEFVQPSAAAIAVNRISDQNGTQILGRLNANGQVFLINPNGVLFGQTTQVDVGGLVASTLDLDDASLTREVRTFSGSGIGQIINRGTIRAAQGGYVAFLGQTTGNHGTITAPAGAVALGSGSIATLTFSGNRLLQMQVDQGVLNSLAENGGLIHADGGVVLMSAGAKNEVLASVVNNTGVIQAQRVENRGGTIVLLGGLKAGTVNVGGVLDASASGAGEGGFIETSAAHVKVAKDARISTTSGIGSSGTWLIDPVDFTISASGGDISGTTLSTNLGSGNVVIQSTSGAAGTSGDVNVNDAVTWSANKLTLNAQNNININANLNASSTASLAFEFGQSAVAAGNSSNVITTGAVVNLPAGTNNFTTKQGSDGSVKSFTVITSLGAAGSVTTTDLQGMIGNLAGNYALGANIDATATSGWNAGAGFAPVGNNTVRFTGLFDGLGHTVTGLAQNRTGANPAGLFGVTAIGSVVRNVGLIGGSLLSDSWGAGALVGLLSGTISNSYTTGTVSGYHASGGLVGASDGVIRDSYATGAVSSYSLGEAGGLVGWNATPGSIFNSRASGNASSPAGNVGGLTGINFGSVSNSYATGTANGTSNVGGFAGWSQGPITGSYSTGTVTGSSAYTGGFVGLNTSSITNSFTTSIVNGSTHVGGLVGRNQGQISGSYASGTVYGANRLGGLAGSSTSTITNSYSTASVTSNPAMQDLFGGLVGENSGNITNSYATGVMVVHTNNAGGLIGLNSGGVITNSYWNTQTTGKATSSGGTGQTTAQLRQQSTYSGWDFTNTWTITEGASYALLRSLIAPLTVTANSQSKTYNGVAHSGGNGVTYSGLKVGIAPTGTLTYGGAAQGKTTVGSYAISPSGLQSNQHYAVTFVDGTLTINKAHLTVTANNTNRLYGQANPAFATTLSGFVNGETAATAAGLSGSGGATSAATATTHVGTVTITADAGTLVATNYDFTNLVNGTLTINKAHLTVTANDASRLYGSANPTFTASLSGFVNGETTATATGLGGSATVTTTATSTTHVGTVAITAGVGTLAATNYDFPNLVNGTLTINKAHLTVTANAASRLYGEANPAFSTTVTGFVNGETAATAAGFSGAANATSAATPLTNVGAATILAGAGTLAATNYDFSHLVDGTLTISKAHLTVTAADASRFYGAANPTFFTTLSGFVNGDTAATAAGLSGSASATTAATPTTDVGTATIASGVGTLAATNYDFTNLVNGTLTINRAHLTVTANDATRLYGEANPTFTTTLSGFVNGETAATAAGLSGTASATTTATTTTNVGTAAIATGVGTLAATNYDFTNLVNGTLTINRAHLTVTANDATRIYGEANPTFTTTLSGFVNGETAATAAGLSGSASATTSATAATNVGTAAITAGAGTLTATNYDFSQFANGVLTISKAALTATATDATKVYDGQSYSGGNGVHYAGFVNGENSSVLSGTLSYSGSSQGAANAGSFVINPHGLTGNNYELTFVSGLLTINRAMLTAVARVASKTYDGTSSATVVVDSLTGLVGSETITTTAAGAFDTKDAGANKTVNVAYTLADGTGLASNYSVANIELRGDITPKSLTFLGSTAANKTYDGTTQATITLGTVSGLVPGEVGSSRVDLQACKLEYSIVSPK